MRFVDRCNNRDGSLLSCTPQYKYGQDTKLFENGNEFGKVTARLVQYTTLWKQLTNHSKACAKAV